MRRRLSYANVVATLALVFAMSGGALAANHYLINSIKQINPKVLKKLKGNIGPNGAAGPAGPQGATGKDGAAGKEGPPGPAGTALAYAHITAGGTIDPGLSSGFGAAVITNPGAGIYCISNLPFTPHSVMAGIDGVTGPAVTEASVNPATFGGCPKTAQVELYTFDPNTGAKEFKFEELASYVLLN
jgi:hypothetical protein